MVYFSSYPSVESVLEVSQIFLRDFINYDTCRNDGVVHSLPIHCIIQTVPCLEDVRAADCQYCLDEKSQTNTKNWWECNCKNVEMSGCVVVPENTCISDFVKTVLLKLGYPSASSCFASGSILIRNWKPLPLKSICPAMNKSVGDILGELTAIVSLRIQIFRPKTTILENIKDNLLNYLIRANRNFLIDSGCPFDMSSLLKLCNPSDYMKRQYFQEPSKEQREKFDNWLQHHSDVGAEFDRTKHQVHLTAFNQPNGGLSQVGVTNQIVRADGGETTPQKSQLSMSQENGENQSKETGKDETLSPFAKEGPGANLMDKPKQSVVPKTRIRTSFDPELELPKLHRWYMENPHPSRQQIYEYVGELNALESRKGRKQLNVNNVLYWFKNARAAQKRTECRKLSGNSAANANRGNVLKIPLGKTPSANSDDQRSLSDDEASLTSESAEDFRNRSDRCLQVVGKWNSNGQGEAVLEMQIGSHKNEFVHSIKKEEKESAVEETVGNETIITDEDSTESVQRCSPSEKGDSPPKSSDKKKKPDEINPTGDGGDEIRNTEKHKTGKVKQINGETKKSEPPPPKSSLRSSNLHGGYKEEGLLNESNFLPPYNSGISNIFEHSLMCMSQYMNPKPNNLPLSAEERRKRNRTFIDPVTEVPRLEEWFRLSTHPSHNLIARYTDELNNMPYRRKFPKLETKNVQFWFKNRRAKNKRLNYLEINK
ncbi:hypothetical protein RUM43_013695 [Polyplax serrata]|uniref:Uncharacterized protein n=1 Tax=Polyplax serrata TaxID=468196 RepID=A0AAN8S2U5_POLSC